ncbi:MAG: diguanylate cyclase [Actinobacteria bacterium]|nr:diguanylate cyclase [Actinomycetota bacterium]
MSTVLVAEDSLVVRAVVRQHLEEHGYSVVEADNGEAAIEICRESPPDIVLLDIEMPGLNGHEVLKILKSDPVLGNVPVVFLTGRTHTGDVVEGLRLGAHDYLKKPFEVTELIARVNAAVRVKILEDELRSRNAELDLISRTDPLTLLYNRRHILERLEQFATSARARGNHIGAVMFDIDHFKRINDSAGHAGGDAVLREFAARLHNSFREDDVAGRWGGEEFVVLVPDADEGMVRHLAETARQCAAGAPFVIANDAADENLDVTTSAGFALDDGRDLPALIMRADRALYRAKEGGRNRVEGN